MYFDYGRDNGLNRAVVPGPAVFEYRTGQHGLPLEKRFNNALMERTHWHDIFRVDTWDDFENRIGTVFHYGSERMPHSMTVICNGLNGLERTTYLLGWDQCGTIKAVCTPSGHLVKKVLYDSFGNVLHDSNPTFVLPLGFAGGLVDPHTGFVRFGHRDYDPEVGRFTDRDPLGDTGGDHDLYEYCVDDPVNKVDPTGLEGIGSDKIIGYLTEPNTDRNVGNKTTNRNEIIDALIEKGKQISASTPPMQKESKDSSFWDNFIPTGYRPDDDPGKRAEIDYLTQRTNEWGQGVLHLGTPAAASALKALSDGVQWSDIPEVIYDVSPHPYPDIKKQH